MGNGALPRPIYTMPDARERWQEQTRKGTAEEKKTFWSLESWSLVYSRFTHQGCTFWWRDTSNFNCHLLFLWQDHWHLFPVCLLNEVCATLFEQSML